MIVVSSCSTNTTLTALQPATRSKIMCLDFALYLVLHGCKYPSKSAKTAMMSKKSASRYPNTIRLEIALVSNAVSRLWEISLQKPICHTYGVYCSRLHVPTRSFFLNIVCDVKRYVQKTNDLGHCIFSLRQSLASISIWVISTAASRSIWHFAYRKLRSDLSTSPCPFGSNTTLPRSE